MSSLPAAGARVRLDDLKVGPLLAEGGEGRVFQLPRQPHLLYKEYRSPDPRPHLEALVAWPETLPPPRAARVRSSAAWPTAVVTGGGGGPVGLLVPRAPRRFSVRHRDGHSRLASLSYLTADPAHRAAAYGLELPAPAGAARLGLVHALARLLAAFESGPVRVGHGDLSTKNVLWSLQRGPEVFVIDCDNAETFDADGSPLGAGLRRRAMTPNWDDPAVPRGANPTLTSDRYSLALIFLRVVGAANFPIQARQRAGGPVEVEFPVPAGPGAEVLLDPDAPVWALCARSLSVAHPEGRPPAAAWVAELARILRAVGAAPVEAPDEVAPAAEPAATSAPPDDVTVVPVRAARRPVRTWSRVRAEPRYPAAPAASGGAGAGGFAWRPLPGGSPAPATVSAAGTGARTAGTRAPATGVAAPPGPRGGGPSDAAMWPELKTYAGRLVRWWLHLHAAMLRTLLTRGRRRRGLRSLAFCLLVDVVVGVILLLFGAVITAPVLGL